MEDLIDAIPHIRNNLAEEIGAEEGDNARVSLRQLSDALDQINALICKNLNMDEHNRLVDMYNDVLKHYNEAAPIIGAGLETRCVTAAPAQPGACEDGQVPLRQRPIPDQLDYYADKLAAQINPDTVPREALIAMGATIVGIGAITAQLRNQDATPSQPEPVRDATDVDAIRQMDEIRRRNQYLRNIPFETHGPGVHGDNCPPCAMVRGIGDVSWLLEQLKQQHAIIARATDLLREYDRHDIRMVNVRQVLGVLSPTWPDGNYEAAPAGGDRG